MTGEWQQARRTRAWGSAQSERQFAMSRDQADATFKVVASRAVSAGREVTRDDTREDGYCDLGPAARDPSIAYPANLRGAGLLKNSARNLRTTEELR